MAFGFEERVSLDSKPCFIAIQLDHFVALCLLPMTFRWRRKRGMSQKSAKELQRQQESATSATRPLLLG